MTVGDLVDSLDLEIVSPGNREHIVAGCYCGDLLSRALNRARQDFVWVTVMTNINILAVAVETGISCVIIAERSEIPENTVKTAVQRGICLLRSPASAFELCRDISALIGE